MINDEEDFDVFIAYHGDEESGTQKQACEIYKSINGVSIGANKCVKAYCKPMTDPHGSFSTTPRIVARTPLFLLVVNKNIPISNYGQIAERSSDGNLKYLYQEIEAFRESEYFKKAKNGSAAKLLLVDEISFNTASKLDPIFAGTEAFQISQNNVVEKIVNWIKLMVSSNQEKIFSKNNIVVANERIDWDRERAKTWHQMKPPSRPSAKEIEIYRKFFRSIKQTKASAAKPKVLILGSTVEFRKLSSQEEFEVTVVDYSKAYYDEASEELSANYRSAETYIECNWCDMAKLLTNKKFDIIIGDLSIGNIDPNQIPTFFSNISELLSNNGYFLGKSIYKYSNYNVTFEQIDDLLKKMVEREDITAENIYQYTMYPLSIFASELIGNLSDDIEGYKINFQDIHSVVKKYSNDNNKFSIFLNESTQFSTKMPKDFYVYSYRTILKQLAKVDLDLEDIIYSTEEYKDDFPLLIIRRKQTDEDGCISINSFLGELSNTYLDAWKNSISSKYFLYNIDGYISTEELVEHIRRLLDNTKITIDKQLNYYLANIPEQSMQEETNLLTINTELSSETKLKDELQFNYTCGILSSIINHYKETEGNGKSATNLLNLILRTLFAHKRQHGKIWIPHESPWVSARICICLFPIYEQWKKFPKKERVYKSKLEDVVTLIAEKDIKTTNYFWESETGSHFDTSALCIETLFLYSEYINNNNLKGKIEAILDEYVRKGRIKETLIKFPIFNSIIDQVCAEEKINRKPAYKKLCGRIEWYTMLYIICRKWGEKNNDTELIEASEYIALQLKRFWRIFVEKADLLIRATIDYEKSLVPQILYCLKRTKLFDSI